MKTNFVLFFRLPHILMVQQPSHFAAAQAQSQAVDPPPSPQRPRASNVTARPRFLDKPASHCTLEPKHANEELAKNEKDAKASALKDGYGHIGGMQATMAMEQAEMKKAQPVVKQLEELKKPVILGPHYPHEDVLLHRDLTLLIFCSYRSQANCWWETKAARGHCSSHEGAACCFCEQGSNNSE